MAVTKAAKAVQARKLEAVVAAWNKRNPVGTPIRYWPGFPEDPSVESVTRSEAWIMPNGIAVAMVEGYAGGVALTHIGCPVAS